MRRFGPHWQAGDEDGGHAWLPRPALQPGSRMGCFPYGMEPAVRLVARPLLSTRAPRLAVLGAGPGPCPAGRQWLATGHTRALGV